MIIIATDAFADFVKTSFCAEEDQNDKMLILDL